MILLLSMNLRRYRADDRSIFDIIKGFYSLLSLPNAHRNCPIFFGCASGREMEISIAEIEIFTLTINDM
jgi:hypothetical protein